MVFWSSTRVIHFFLYSDILVFYSLGYPAHFGWKLFFWNLVLVTCLLYFSPLSWSSGLLIFWYLVGLLSSSFLLFRSLVLYFFDLLAFGFLVFWTGGFFCILMFRLLVVQLLRFLFELLVTWSSNLLIIHYLDDQTFLWLFFNLALWFSGSLSSVIWSSGHLFDWNSSFLVLIFWLVDQLVFLTFSGFCSYGFLLFLVFFLFSLFLFFFSTTRLLAFWFLHL